MPLNISGPSSLTITFGSSAVVSVTVTGGSGSYEYAWVIIPPQPELIEALYLVANPIVSNSNTTTLTALGVVSSLKPFTVEVGVLDLKTGKIGAFKFSVSIIPLSGQSTTNVTVGVPVNINLNKNNSTYLTFATTSPLPPGLTLSSNGLISGTPTNSAASYPLTYTINYSVTSHLQSPNIPIYTTSYTFAIVVSLPQAPQFSISPQLYSGTPGSTLMGTITDISVVATTITNTVVPPGVALIYQSAVPANTTAGLPLTIQISTGAQPGTNTIAFTAMDSYGNSSTFGIVLQIQSLAPQLSINPTTYAGSPGFNPPPTGQIFDISPLQTTLSASNLPSDVTINFSINPVPPNTTTAIPFSIIIGALAPIGGPFTINIQSTDTNQNVSSVALTLNIFTVPLQPTISISPLTFEGIPGSVLSGTITVISEVNTMITYTPNFSFILPTYQAVVPPNSGPLPLTITLADPGSVIGTYNLTFQATDSFGQTASTVITVIIDRPVPLGFSIAPNNLQVVQGFSVSTTMDASSDVQTTVTYDTYITGVTVSYLSPIPANSQPLPLTFNASIDAPVGTYNYTFVCSDSYGNNQPFPVTLQIIPRVS